MLLRSDQESNESKITVDATLEILKTFAVVEVKVKGKTTLESIFYGSYMADYTSCYLALLYGVNPSSTDYSTQILESTSASINALNG